MSTPFQTHDLFVSPLGNDNWSGRLPEPNAEGTDGPLASLARARDLLRRRKQQGEWRGPTTVWVRGGRYELAAPLVFTPDDSAPVTYAAYPGERPIFSGGRRITGWRAVPHPLDPSRGEVWMAELPDVAAGKWAFRQLFVNGERRHRPRLPKITPGSDGRDDFYRIAHVANIRLEDASIATLFEGYDRFIAAPGQFDAWRNLGDIEVVVLHYWIEERMPVASYDPDTREVVSTRYSMFALRDDFTPRYARYYVDNVFEALSEPGEWYLERRSGRLYYIPCPGERIETLEAYAPAVEQFLKLAGEPDSGRYVEFLCFRGLTFEHADWRELDVSHEADTGMPTARRYAASPQAATHVPGTIALVGARYCAIEDCVVRHVGYYGIELGDGCRGIRIVGNDIGDLGGGGIKLGGADAGGPLVRRTGDNLITDNHIHDGGKVYHSAVGVFAKHTFGNRIAHNHIHDFYYSGISCGWVWGYRESVSRDNRLEKNHIHDLGKGWLSDMGGIYTLGVQPGTTIRGNLIHDVEKANYGGWAIYLDEGSAHILVEDNVCYNTSSQPHHTHYGRENILRNNIWAFGREGQIALGRAEPHVSLTFERNIVITRGQPIFIGGYANDFSKRSLISDLNLFWDVSGGEVILSGMRQSGRTAPVPKFSLSEWQAATGNDRHSLVADPGFRDLANFDFTLAPDSPALMLGFRPIDLSDVGPRPPERRD
ncbi:MAG: right-handed parallel beta-helix repeat-containing protein [Anaerolineae bacterium]|nr:right-handed parallel beta-helix repeat-containing protein [Anaerolineae bacterium]